MERVRGPRSARRALGRLLEAVLASRAEANAVFDILAVLQVRRAERSRVRGRKAGPAGESGLGRGETLRGGAQGFTGGSSLVPRGSRAGGSGGRLGRGGTESPAGVKAAVRWGGRPSGDVRGASVSRGAP